MPLAHGPDTSHYQTIVNEALLPQWEMWSHKIGEGTGGSDAKLASFLPIMRKHAKRIGVYFWLRPDSTPEAQFANLKNRLAGIGGLKPNMMVQIDWERTDSALNVNDGFPTLAQVERFQALCEAQWPGRIIMYSADWVRYFKQWRAKYPNYPLWYANYTSQAVAVATSYGATVVQWTSRYTHPAMVSSAQSPGFDMNQVLKFDVLDRVCGLVDEPAAVDGGDSGVEDVPTPAPVPRPALKVEIEVKDKMFIADSDTHGSALVTPVVLENNAGSFRMSGISGSVRDTLVSGGVPVVHWPDWAYDVRAQQQLQP